MDNYEICRDAMRGIILGDNDDAARQHRRLDAEGRRLHDVMLTMMFAAGLQAQFGTESLDLTALQTFARQLHHEHAGTEPPVRQLDVEALVRGTLGEEHFLDHLDWDTEEHLQRLAIRKIYLESDHMQQHLKDYLSDVEKIARHWVATEGLPE